MPEGDVVLRTAKRLHTALAGRELVTSDLRWPSLATTDLTGRTVLEVVAAGKHLLIRVDGGPAQDGPAQGPAQDPGVTLHSHLRMEGSWHVHRTGEPWPRPRSASGIRAVLANTAWTAIGHKLGMLDLVRTDREDTLVGHLGPDVLGADWDEDVATANVLATPGVTIGEALLDQRNVAGIGTFYLGEAAFLRGLNPWTPVADLDEDAVRAVLRMAHRLLGANLDRAVQVTTGDARRGQEAYVHARSGRPCRRCGTPIRVADLYRPEQHPEGRPVQTRVEFWCPRCQPGDVPTDTGAAMAPLGSSRGARGARGTYRPNRR